MKVLLFLLAAFIFGGTSLYAQPSDRDSFSFMITEENSFSFSPTETGYWTFYTSQYWYSAGRPFLSIENEFGFYLDSGDFITLHLVEGAEYIVYVGFWGEPAGQFMLNISFSDIFEPFVIDFPPVTGHAMPPAGGRLNLNGEVEISFTPMASGLWAFQVYSDSAPFPMWIDDPFGNTLAFDNFWDVGDHAAFTIHLVEGVEYTISTMMFMWEPVDFTVSARFADEFTPWIDHEFLYFEGFNLDLDAPRTNIPAMGGEIAVDGETWFSFTPDTTGPWTFITSDNDGDPLLVLTDIYASFFLGDDDSAGDLNSLINVYLTAGVEYVIWARFWLVDGEGSYTLMVAPFEELPVEEEDVLPIPGVGGSFPITGDLQYFTFTPNVTDTWAIYLNVGPGIIYVHDISTSFVLGTDFWNSSPLVTVDLAAGVEYRIVTWLDWVADDATLSVSPADWIHAGASDTFLRRHVARQVDFAFTSDTSGYWIIYTFDENLSDPYLWVLDSYGNIIAEDDDSGIGLNAQIKVYLEAGAEYTIRAGFFTGDLGRYSLGLRRVMPQTVRPRLHI